MKNLIFVSAITLAFAACGDGSTGAGPDSTSNPSDTTNLHINPATEDPNSNMADTMHMIDSSRVKDTSIKDNTTVKPKKQ